MFRSRAKSIPPEAKGTALADLIALSGPGAARWSGRDAVSLAHAGFRRNPVAYRCIQMISEAAASIGFVLSDAMGAVEETPLSTLLRQPNPDQTRAELLEALYGHLQINGNAYLEIVGPLDAPIALYALRPDRVRIDCDGCGWPTQYVYRTARGERRIGRDGEGRFPLIHLRLFSPVDDAYGQSPLSVAADALDVHNAATAWNKSLLDNAARPSGALVYRGPDGATLTGEQFDRLKAELTETYTGARNAGRPMVLDGGLDWKQMSLSPAEMSFLDLKHGAAREIALAFGVPPMLLGIPGDNTYANYAQARLAFWQQAILPLAEKTAAAIGAALCPSGMTLTVDRESIEALKPPGTDRLALLLRSDDVTPAEKRVALGLPAEPAL